MTPRINIDTAYQHGPYMIGAAVFFKGNIIQNSYMGKLYHTISTTFAIKKGLTEKNILIKVSWTPLTTKSAISTSNFSAISNLYAKRL
jgi:hypothetical protein